MFQAWAVNTRNTLASSAPTSWPGKRLRKNTRRKVANPSTGTDCRMSSSGTSTSSARRLLAASVP